jgi:tight adherence protein B
VLVLVLASACAFTAVYLLVRYGREPVRRFLARQEMMYDRVLRRQLLLEVHPRAAVGLAVGSIVAAGLLGLLLGNSVLLGLVFAVVACFVPQLILKHMEQKRRERLERQLIDGLMTLASGVRAGLNLVQAMELIANSHKGPMQQEFAQLLREYHLGLDLNQALRNASNRIGSQLYRLTFTAIEMHRVRGGDTGVSLDRIAESIREIQRLEGKLDALTAQGRFQAMMMAALPPVFLLILWGMDPDAVSMLFVEPAGRLLLLGVAGLIALGFVWIRKIMAIDI